MVRKHTRRAAKAAFAISLGVALLIGLTACGGGKKKPTAAAKPTILVGNKDFGEEFILGQLYGQALQAKGFHVVFKGNLGESELADKAITSGKMNLYPEYTGVIVQDLEKVKNAPKSAAATYTAAKKFEQSRGLTILNATPFFDSDTFTVLTSNAQRYGLKTMSDLSKVKSGLSFAGLPACPTRITCLLGMKQIYGLKNIKFIPIGNISVFTLLDEHKAFGGDGFSTAPQNLDPKYTVLIDDKHIFGFQYVVPVLKASLLKGPSGTLLKNTLNTLSSKLTLPAIEAMNKAYVVDKATPKEIAAGFLKANGLSKK